MSPLTVNPLKAYEAVVKAHGFARLSKFSITSLKGRQAFSRSYLAFNRCLEAHPEVILYTDDYPTNVFFTGTMEDESDRVAHVIEIAQNVRRGVIPPKMMRTFFYNMGESYHAFPLIADDPNGVKKLDDALRTRGRHDVECAICYEPTSQDLELVHCSRCSASVCRDCRVKIHGCPACRKQYGTLRVQIA